ncbi:hypothetical protein [Bartonella pachyuromydis]|uniref:Protein-disulfide reductase n=1 Tax=Bartonella pachyuromydis TaxID=931097 RepID=A0ABP8VEM9_9HYPH
MTKLFKNYILNVFIVAVFFLSQIVNVNANYLQNTLTKEIIIDRITGKEKNNLISITAFRSLFYDSNLNHKPKNNVISESNKGKIENVAEFVTMGVFDIGMAIGYTVSTVGLLLGFMINKIITLFK